ncbi:MAG: hypothetical protein GAK43_02229 [Stenotrophomonas maltophilia]|nr:MAG: hypothetical protein GAK43_02229 [Stenotrophomonas maltophilia]
MNRCVQLTLASVLVLSGCSSTPLTDKAVEQARSEFQAVRDDTSVLHSAPRDVIRAGESLGRAERLSSYWGSRDDVLQYAYLSQRYSEIARERANLDLNQERLAKQQLERERLQLSLREAKLASVQEQSKWLEEQMVSLATNQTERGLVLTHR